MTPRRLIRIGLCASWLAHALALVALAAWPRFADRVQFAGRRQATPLVVSFDQPRWDVEQATLELPRENAPVVIQPAEARIAKRRYLIEPVAKLAVGEDVAPSAQVVPPVLLMRAPPIDSPEPRQGKPRPRKPTAADVSIESVASPASPSGSTDETPPDLSRNPPPAYPAVAVQRRWEGTVLLRVWIDETGAVTRVDVARTSGHQVLDGAAAHAVRRWHSSPARRGGRPVSTVELLPVRFEL